MPEVANTIVIPLGHGELRLLQRWRIGRKLLHVQYDQAIVLPNSWKSAVIPFSARISTRTGYVGELRGGLLNDARKLDKTSLRRTVERFVALGLPPEASGAPEITAPKLESDPATCAQAVARFGLEPQAAPIAALCPGAEYGPAKQWPPHHFADLAKQLLDAGWQVWLFGSANDASATWQINEATIGRCRDLAGVTSLGEACDLLSLARVVVTNDSGLMHVAAALGRPVVCIYGSSDPGFTPPLTVHATILSLGLECSPCFARTCPLGHTDCLQKLSPDLALEAVLGLSE